MATAVIHGQRPKEPHKIRNSPTKPFNPGSPLEASITSRKNAGYTGTAAQSPPKSAMRRVWRRS